MRVSVSRSAFVKDVFALASRGRRCIAHPVQVCVCVCFLIVCICVRLCVRARARKGERVRERVRVHHPHSSVLVSDTRAGIATCPLNR